MTLTPSWTEEPRTSPRIQSLAESPAVWVAVIGAIIDDRTGVARLSLRRIDDPLSDSVMELPLGELLRPFAEMFPPRPTRASPSAHAAFLLRTAEALRDAATPIRVLPAGNQRWSRPASLLALRGALPGGGDAVRIKCNWSQHTLIDHLWKHFVDPVAAAVLPGGGLNQHADDGRHGAASLGPEFFARRVLRAAKFHLGDRWTLPITARHLERALSVARSASCDAKPTEILAAWWPLAEIYTSLSVHLYTHLLEGPAAHFIPPGYVPAQLEETHNEPLGEELYAFPLPDALLLAKGDSLQGDRPLYWSTTHPRHDGTARLEHDVASRLRLGWNVVYRAAPQAARADRQSRISARDT